MAENIIEAHTTANMLMTLQMKSLGDFDIAAVRQYPYGIYIQQLQSLRDGKVDVSTSNFWSSKKYSVVKRKFERNHTIMRKANL